MKKHIYPTAADMGRAAAEAGARLIRAAIDERGSATIIVATGASQFRVLEALVQQEVDWSKVTGFHLDEYIGLPLSHPASFRAYLKERFVDLVPLAAFHYVDGEYPDPAAECARLGALIPAVDVAFIGIGENAHIAFNDPPADFETDAAYIVVELDQACRQQQFGEGWFPSLETVPRQAISMSVRKIMASNHIICSVPDERKAAAVAACVNGPVTPDAPASILQEHPACDLFLDAAAAGLLGSN